MTESSGTQQCSACLETKSVLDFHVKNSYASGRVKRCKRCCKATRDPANEGTVKQQHTYNWLMLRDQGWQIHHRNNKRQSYIAYKHLNNQTTEIHTFDGIVTIDTEDWDNVKPHGIYINARRGSVQERVVYKAVMLCVNNRNVTLARHIMPVSTQHDIVDHINGDTMNNCKTNLRCTDSSGNNKNKCINVRNTSGINGVSLCTINNTWQARVLKNGKWGVASFRFGGKRLYRTFEQAKQLAIDAKLANNAEIGNTNGQRPKL